MGLDERTGRGQTIRWLKKGTEPGALALLKMLSAFGVTIEPAPPEDVPRALNAELAEMRREIRRLSDQVATLASSPQQQAAAADLRRDAEEAEEAAPPSSREGSLRRGRATG